MPYNSIACVEDAGWWGTLLKALGKSSIQASGCDPEKKPRGVAGYHLGSIIACWSTHLPSMLNLGGSGGMPPPPQNECQNAAILCSFGEKKHAYIWHAYNISYVQLHLR